MQQPTVSFNEDGTMYLMWPRVLFTFDEDGFGYAIRDGDRYKPGKFNTWPEAVKEIQSAISAES